MSNTETAGVIGVDADPARALASGDLPKALEILKRALEFDPDNLAAQLSYAGLLRATGRIDEALTAVAEALRIQPRSFHALLMKGSIFDSQGKFTDAGRTYALALMFAPAETELDRATVTALRRARELYSKYTAEFSGQIRAAVDANSQTSTAGERRRFDKFVDIVTGKHPVYEQKPSDFHFPGLPAIEFYDDDVFPWIAKVESYFDEILGELQAFIGGGMDRFAPYVQLPSDVPVDQWADLNHSIKWSSLFVKQNGRVVEDNAPRFPKTLEALSFAPQPIAPNRSPVAMFSALQPHTRIPPHHGVSNCRLVLHLPLIVPENCGFRVGSETRQWVPGKAWVFNDTIEHEAWNESDDLRVILIADVWNPLLSEYEREMYGVMLSAFDDFHGETASHATTI
jgi:aspartate beta-hydroxylase